MNNIDKAILLAEGFGVDTRDFRSSYVEGIIKSASYIHLVDNVKWANNFKLRSSQTLLSDFRSINYSVDSFEKAIVLASRINYLSEVSDEKYYLNPLAYYYFSTRTKSIGELMLSYDGTPHSFNEVIADASHPLAYKAKAISSQAEYYRQELSESALMPYGVTEKNRGIGKIVRGHVFKLILTFMAVVFFSIAVLFVMLSNYTFCREFMTIHSFSNPYTYGFFILFVASALLMLDWAFLFSYLNKAFSPFFYYKKFGKKRAGIIYDNINKSAQRLAEYIFKACQSKTPLTNDIKKFAVANGKNSGVSLYRKMYDVDANKYYIVLDNILHFLMAILLMDTIFLIVYYLSVSMA